MITFIIIDLELRMVYTRQVSFKILRKLFGFNQKKVELFIFLEFGGGTFEFYKGT